MTVRMDLSKHGAIVDVEAFPSAIRSRARLSYDMVDQLLDRACVSGDLPCEPQDQESVADALMLLDEIARLREEIRRKRGSIDFATTESKVILDEDGTPIDVVVRERTRATGLIEEAMLMANESVAKMLADRDVQTAYRVHERPSPEDLAACVPALRELGALRDGDAEGLAAADPRVIQNVLAAAEGTGGEYLANTLLLRAQKRAIYLPHNDGHYALGASAYCHFTSPIRRYPDMLVHRVLKWQLYGRADARERREIQKALPQLCRTCSDRERVADAAARTSQKVKMAELYAGRIGERYSGVVVGCERFGLFIMLNDTCAEGVLPARALGDEWFYYDDERMRLVGESTGKIWHVGQRVAVSVSDVDIPKGRVDFILA